MATLANVVYCYPEIFSGTPVFTGTRIPVCSLFDYLEGGDTLEKFLCQFPSIKRDQALAVLDAACESVTTDAHLA